MAVQRIIGSFTAAAVALAAVAVLSVNPVAANPADINDYYSRINVLRTANGLPALIVDGPLASSAAGWAQTMADTATLAHDPNLAAATSGWTTIGENVGTGSDNIRIWDAFLASPAHVSNILNPAFTHMGVGVVYAGTQQFTAQRFMAIPGGGAPPPPPPVPPAAQPPPPPVAPLGPATPPAPPPSSANPANPGDTVDCGDFTTYANALDWYNFYAPLFGDVARLDADGDGRPCGHLPGSPVIATSQDGSPAGSTPANPNSSPTGQAGATTASEAGASGATTTPTSADPGRVAIVLGAIRSIEA